MEKNEILQFLHAIDEELALSPGPEATLDIYLLGRAALILRYGLTLATRDVDLVIYQPLPGLQERAFELFGKGTPNAQKWRLYLEAVPAGLPPVPGSYRTLSVELPGPWKVLRPHALEVHHLAITKLHRFHAGDREDLRIPCDSGDLNKADLRKALDSAFPFGFDEEEDPHHKQVKDHFAKVLAYLDGLASAL